MNGQKLKEFANKFGIADEARLGRVLCRIDNGADIGCVGEFRAATYCANAPDAYQNGKQVTDAIASWIKKGFAYGPVDEDDLPANAKINGILTRQKPDGTVRIILNLSAPKGLLCLQPRHGSKCLIKQEEAAGSRKQTGPTLTSMSPSDSWTQTSSGSSGPENISKNFA
jgi:hypothetical protein